MSIDEGLNSESTYLVQVLVQRSGDHPVFFRHMDRFTCQHVVGISVRKFTGIFTERLVHA
jgi:hypothetical protein